MGIRRRFEPELLLLGLYAWDVPNNRVVGDEIFARLHDLPTPLVAQGVPVEYLIGRILDGDRERTARELHSAILSGDFVSSTFRIKIDNGNIRRICWYGRCLRDPEGIPSQFVGAIADEAAGALAETIQLTLQMAR